MTRTLILIPTEFEADLAAPWLKWQQSRSDLLLEICGFGPIVAGIRTAQLLCRHQPQACVLLGVAGSLHPSCVIGSAAIFDQISCDGVGVGSGLNHQSAAELGWPVWPEALVPEGRSSTLQLRVPPGKPAAGESSPGEPAARTIASGHLLTVCAASASLQEARDRQKRFPGVTAEDMEAYAVALACVSAGTPLQVIRGISNNAGDRDKRNWDIPAALKSAAALVHSLIMASADFSNSESE